MQKYYYLHTVIERVLDYFPCDIGINWSQCCDETVDKLRESHFLGTTHLESGRILRKCFHDFRNYGRKLNVPSIGTNLKRYCPINPFRCTRLLVEYFSRHNLKVYMQICISLESSSSVLKDRMFIVLN